MEVIIRERAYEYESDYKKNGGDDGWHYSAGDCYKFPVKIGRSNCFIKRFEKKTPESISGWRLMHALKGHYEPGLPRLHDIVGTKEEGKTIYYVFYEHLEGCTLDSAIQKGMPVDLEKLVGDIFLALGSVHRQEYWFADFCEKNIFCNTAGRYFLIDLDSAQPGSAAPENDMYADKEYWALAFTYIVHEVGFREFKPAHISGILLNYLQAIFLVLRTKVSLIDRKSENRSVELFDTLPHLLDEWAPEFKPLFKTLLEDPSRVPDSSDVQRIKDILLEKIVLRTGAYSLDVRSTARKENGREPVIRYFRSDKKIVGSREDFRLEWAVDRADQIQLYRYKVLLKKLEHGATGITLNEMYDGQEKDVRYTLSVYNEYGHAKSEPIHIVVREVLGDAGPADNVISRGGKDPVTPREQRPTRDPEPEKRLKVINGGKASHKWFKPKEGEEKVIKTRQTWSKTKGLKTILLVVLGILLAGGVLAFWLAGSFTVKAGLYGFQPKTVNGPGEVVLYGEHFPANKNTMHVLFNTTPGTIQSATDEKLVVQLPWLGDKELRVQVRLIVGGDTLMAGEELQYQPLTAVKVDSVEVKPVAKAKAEKRPIGEDKDPHTKPSHDAKHQQTNIPKVDNTVVTPPPVHENAPYNADKDTADIAPIDKVHAILEARLAKDSVRIISTQYKKTLGVFDTRVKKLFSNESSLTLDRVKLQIEQEDGSGSEIRILQKVKPYEKRLLIDNLPKKTTLKIVVRNIHLQK